MNADSPWYRVFGTSTQEPAAAAVLEQVRTIAASAEGNFRGDSQGWFGAEFTLGHGSLHLERYLVTEEGIRAELNNWAAWIETNEGNPHQGRLMELMIGTQQLFTIRQAGGLDNRELAEHLCRFLARATAGVYQADQRGFFDADGSLLMPE